MPMDLRADKVLVFWFDELKRSDWFSNSPELDREISVRFGDALRAAANCELFEWRRSAEGRLAEIIVLDQFSRNVYRGQALAFQQDTLALALAQEAVSLELHLELEASRRAFLLMPYMHSESLIIHEQALHLFAAPGLESNLKFEQQHLQVLQQFGRYPRRNQALGRVNTAKEREYLNSNSRQF